MNGIAEFALASVLLAATPATPAAPAAPAKPTAQADLVLNCYVVQSSRADLGQFVRHLEIQPSRSLVVIADGVRGEPPRWVGNGRLVSLDANQVVFDFAAANSAGRTQVDRRTGAFSYSDGRSVIRGSCQPSSL